MKRFSKLSVNVIPFLALLITLICLVINNAGLRNDLSDCQSKLSQIHITNLDLKVKNEKLKNEVADNKSKIKTLKENNEIQSKLIAEYKTIIDNYEEKNIVQEVVNTLPVSSVTSNLSPISTE